MLLNMSSIAATPTANPTIDDRTAKARIRDAAIECFAENGVDATTARKVAAAADVSPGLVMHHFESMKGLRVACDEYVAATIRQLKSDAMSTGPDLDLLAALRGAKSGSLMGYLAAVLSEDSPAVAKLVDELVSDAEGYLEQGVASGMVLASPDPRGRAAVMLLWSLGALVLHRQVYRILGVDLTAPEVVLSPEFSAYAGPAYEIMSNGILTEEFAANVRETFPSPAADATRQSDRPNQTTEESKAQSKAG